MVITSNIVFLILHNLLRLSFRIIMECRSLIRGIITTLHYGALSKAIEGSLYLLFLLPSNAKMGVVENGDHVCGSYYSVSRALVSVRCIVSNSTYLLNPCCIKMILKTSERDIQASSVLLFIPLGN